MPKKAVRVYQFLTGKRVFIALSGILTVAFILRVVLPMQVVFGSGYINFLEGDAYNRMYYAMQIQSMPFVDGFTYAVPRGLLFPWIIAMLGYIFPIELVGAWLPPFIAMGVIVLVYLIGTDILNSFVGLMAAIFVAIIPSEFYHRSLLGYPDHHVMEVLLMTLVVYLTIKAIRSRRWASYYSLAAGFALFLYLANWAGGILMVGILFLTALVFLVQKIINKTYNMRAVYSLLLIVGIGAALYSCLGGFVRFFWWLPWIQETGSAISVAQASGMVSETAASMFTPLSQRTVSELMPLFTPFGTFSIGVVMMNLHLFVITFVIGFYCMWVWRRDRVNLFVIIWTILILILTLNERRYLYYFTLPVGLLSAWGVYKIGQLSKEYATAIIVMLTMLLILISLPVLLLTGTSRAFSMPSEWHDALVWLHDEPDNGMVTAWADYGHWIQYTAGKTPSVLPGPGGKSVIDLLFTTDDEEAQQLLDGLSTQYLIVDRDTMVNKVAALEIISGGDMPSEDSLANRLLNGESVSYLTLEYESDNIKIYEVMK